MKTKTEMNKTIIWCLGVLLIVTNNLYAQQDSPYFRSSQFAHNHITFNVSGLNVFSVKSADATGLGEFQTARNTSAKLGLSYMLNPYQHLGISFGFNLGVQSFGYWILATEEDFGIPNGLQAKRRIPEPFLEFPIKISPRLALSDRNWLQLEMGVALSFYLSSALDIEVKHSVNQVDNVASIQFNFPAENPYIQAVGGIGWMHVLKNRDMIKLGVEANLGFKEVLLGQYQFLSDNIAVGEGTFVSKGTYIAVSLGYIFTSMKRIKDY